MRFGRRETVWPRWIEQQLVRRGIQDERVLRAFAAVPRSAFVPSRFRAVANDDGPLPIGCGQTISQPFVVARCLEALALTGTETVLDVGTGSGYQACLLSHLTQAVYTIEVHKALYERALQPMERNRKAPIHACCGDGALGWPEAAPFQAMVVGAWAERPPQALVDQLDIGGRLLIPLGHEEGQVLVRLTKASDGALHREVLEQVRFVPLVPGDEADEDQS